MDHQTREMYILVRPICIQVLLWRMLQTKGENNHLDCYKKQVQKPGHVMVTAFISAFGRAHLLFSHGSVNAEMFVEILWSHI